MQLNRLLIIAVAALFISTAATAQTTSGSEIKKADADFTELANYSAEHPRPFKRVLPFDESEETEPVDDPATDLSQVHYVNRSAARIISPGGPSFLPVSQAPADTFESTKSNGEDIPPDTHGDVSPDYLMTTINSTLHIQTRTGANVSQVDINTFWSSVLPAGTDPFDPKIVYDPNYRRWVLVTDAVNNTTMGSSTILIAVSETCNPRGIWHQYAIAVDPTDAAWLDFPNIGINSKWVTITGNMFANTMGGATGAVVYVFNYASLMSGAGATFVQINQPSLFTLCPAITYDVPQQNMFLVDVKSANSGQLQVWKITGPVGAPVMASVGIPASFMHWKTSGPGGNDFAQQLGTTNKLDAGDDRITRLTYRNNKLWCAHTIFLPTTGSASRCSVMWWEIDTLANPLQNGIIDDPATPSFYMYPSITSNANDDALIGFSYTSSLIYPSCAYALHMHTDPADSMRPYVVFRQGQTNYFQNFGGAKNRWGDYSAACVDPINNIDFWTIQETVPSVPSDYWDTWWAHIQLSSGTPGLGASNNPVSPNFNDTIKFNGIIPAGTVATWNFGGGTSTPETGTGNQLTKWTTSGWKVITLTDSVPGCTTTYTDSIYVSATAAVKPVTVTNQDMQVAPNPNNGAFDILFTKPVTDAAIVKLLDMQGRIVYSEQFTVVNDRISVATNKLAPGIYLANVTVNGSVITQKITIASR